ncbi:MAG: DUF2304 domain-containing protein [Patescibacteria group bacterium]
MMTGIQIIAAAFGLFMAYLTFVQYKKKDFNRYQFFIWEVLWLGFVIVTILPEKFNFFTEKLGIARAFDLFAIVAFVIILFLVFYNYLLITKIEKRLVEKTRDKALNKINKNK